ncbi:MULTISPECIES: fimbrial protein [Xenorhabdus]|uniref:Major type 1 subunit fimbrin (Pilin) n=1 Tax=Xenorhabdus ehlersii TaxID=290111 RepID=A0A2D0IRX7_9GAMM|nr:MULTISPECIES: fimbrial protein [Xenorhabdus]MBC8949471.1 putative fimbrial subunit protein [Xenorhabdus sp. TS4]PHM24647.1 putative fimbrial subunit protein [Xenorhabdus ehlersii]RKE91284.1 major type 1 subunit fimbrin (pilin) [Xenorhabdus ehlersii]
MKTKLIISSLFVSSVFMSTAHAADGQIKFTGKITATACKVDSNSANQTVNMGTISSSSFAGAYSTSAATRFSIKLTDCPKDYQQAQVKFDGQPDRASSRLLALNSNGGENPAQGIAIALYEDDSNTMINLAENSRPQYFSQRKTEELKFVAKYMATAETVTPGAGDAVANFTIIYN